MMVQFLLLMVGLDKIYYTPMGNFMDQRDASIKEKVEAKIKEGRMKVEAELQEALAKLEKQKDDTILALDAQIGALSEDIVKKVLPGYVKS
ncbi:ATP synthase subunit b', chloroplastic [Linum perenne]